MKSSGKTARPRPLHAMFSAVPPRYDLINRIVTWGLDKHWRKKAAGVCLDSRPRKVIDLCCGTGDLAVDIAKLARGDLEVIALDYTQIMLDKAAEKARSPDRNISFVLGEVANLPFADKSFDRVAISFAFRNLTYKNPLASHHIAEMLRILRDGGGLVIVETSQPESKPIRKLYHVYLRHIVANLGALISGNRGAYHYLAQSVTQYYNPEGLQRLLLDAGFRQVSCQPLFFGAIGIYVALK